MSTKAHFTPTEWETLRNAPHLAAAAVMIAGRSGILGSLKEAFTIAQSFYESATSTHPLLTALNANDELSGGQDFVRSQISLREAVQAAEKLRTLAIQHCQAAMALLQQKGEAGEAKIYADWLLEVANKVANAAKEGAFLGFGGERVSADEEAVLQDLATALHIPTT